MNFPLKKSKAKTHAVENLSARVYNQIKRLILCNEIMPGQNCIINNSVNVSASVALRFVKR